MAMKWQLCRGQISLFTADRGENIKTSFAAKNAKFAKENTSSFFNFAHIAFFAAEKLFLCALCVSAVIKSDG
jgi:hypothetical protein